MARTGTLNWPFVSPNKLRRVYVLTQFTCPPIPLARAFVEGSASGWQKAEGGRQKAGTQPVATCCILVGHSSEPASYLAGHQQAARRAGMKGTGMAEDRQV